MIEIVNIPAVLRPPAQPPTRKCALCGRLENPAAATVSVAFTWLCEDCLRKLRKILEVSVSSD